MDGVEFPNIEKPSKVLQFRTDFIFRVQSLADLKITIQNTKQNIFNINTEIVLVKDVSQEARIKATLKMLNNQIFNAI